MRTLHTYQQWFAAIDAGRTELYRVKPYLNSEGLDKFNALDCLYGLGCYCDSATELVEWIDTDGDLAIAPVEKRTLELNYYCKAPLRRLRKIAAAEKELLNLEQGGVEA